MSSAPGGGQAGPPQRGPPYTPRNSSLGGLPAVIPDIPPTAVFLFLYVVFAATHQKIFITNKQRGHKFNFSGALFGFCAIRIVTMSLRIAWACYPRNVSLGIAAQVFVYVGTIILYICNWFFAQRIVRAQHPRFGWSKPYRVLHRGAVVCMILCLFLLIVGAIQQCFTLDANTLRIDRNLQLTGQTYFAVFTIAPIVAVTLSLIVPRSHVDKFGAGRMKNNIAILLIAAAILAVGQIFRVVIAWLPATSLRNAQGRPNDTPWYYSKACFYTFNFTTEILVAMAYAVVRIDLRFHVPDGCKGPGDYQAKRQSKFKVNIAGSEKELKRRSKNSIHSNHSTETLQEYEGSLFDDSQTLADSLRYPSTVLEVDRKSGHWKVKRVSRPNSMHSVATANYSQNSMIQDAPPLPNSDWPLRESQIPTGQIPKLEHRNRGSVSSPRFSKSKLSISSTPELERSDALEQAARQLEANSEISNLPPLYSSTTSRYSRSLKSKHDYSPSVDDSPNIPTQTYHYPPSFSCRASIDMPKKSSSTYMPPTPKSPLSNRPPSSSSSNLPKKHTYTPLSNPATSPSPDLPKKYDYSADQSPHPEQRENEGSRNEYPRHEATEKRNSLADDASREVTRTDIEAANREFERFSYEVPSRWSFDEGERLLERMLE
ncbi:hypothetical protein CC80DRAFT_440166 [Byssothecium circinans]|uniref:DUF3112 domain-containing protein n=1 Tax=Byssothecium circinans TaxID=147558 RepID=A0A6A5U7Y0_9PLEO|nr:hypothetical protein CC80DRAFT_440166 [Byssothecium circinans]